MPPSAPEETAAEPAPAGDSAAAAAAVARPGPPVRALVARAAAEIAARSNGTSHDAALAELGAMPPLPQVLARARALAYVRGDLVDPTALQALPEPAPVTVAEACAALRALLPPSSAEAAALATESAPPAAATPGDALAHVHVDEAAHAPDVAAPPIDDVSVAPPVDDDLAGFSVDDDLAPTPVDEDLAAPPVDDVAVRAHDDVTLDAQDDDAAAAQEEPLAFAEPPPTEDMEAGDLLEPEATVVFAPPSEQADPAPVDEPVLSSPAPAPPLAAPIPVTMTALTTMKSEVLDEVEEHSFSFDFDHGLLAHEDRLDDDAFADLPTTMLGATFRSAPEEPLPSLPVESHDQDEPTASLGVSSPIVNSEGEPITDPLLHDLEADVLDADRLRAFGVHELTAVHRPRTGEPNPPADFEPLPTEQSAPAAEPAPSNDGFSTLDSVLEELDIDELEEIDDDEAELLSEYAPPPAPPSPTPAPGYPMQGAPVPPQHDAAPAPPHQGYSQPPYPPPAGAPGHAPGSCPPPAAPPGPEDGGPPQEPFTQGPAASPVYPVAAVDPRPRPDDDGDEPKKAGFFGRIFNKKP
ncbi:hypothetical protein [Haliangium sp.]|uniref:hypothetical protein n=1 Tax=Haliangium sp. TaxID=2663208 RepID=UPI003D0C2273